MVPSYTFFATVTSMRVWRLVPVFVDINPTTLNPDVEDVQRRLTPRTKAIVPAQRFGLPWEMEQIGDFAAEKGLLVLEDCSHSHGASVGGKMTGLWGPMSMASMQLGKPLPSVEGGVGMYETRASYDRATALGQYEACPRFPKDSRYPRYADTGLGLKLRISPLAAVVSRGPVVPRQAGDPRNAARLSTGQPDRDGHPLLHQARGGTDRPVRPGLREGVGPPSGARQGVSCGHLAQRNKAAPAAGRPAPPG